MLNNIKYTNIDGLRIAYYDEGSGDPIVFLHGIPTSSYLWRKIAPKFASKNRMIVLDLYGFGKSEKPLDGDYSILGYIKFLKKFFDSLKLKKVTIVAHDFGGIISLGYALQYPKTINKLVLSSTTIYDDHLGIMEMMFKNRLMARLSTIFTTRYSFNSMISRGLDDPSNLSKKDREEYFKPFKKMSGRVGIEKAMSSCTNLQYIKNWQRKLPKFTVPTLIIYGNSDRYILKEHMERLSEDLPNAKLTLLEKAGHLLQEDKPIKFTRIVKKFLSED